MRIWTKLTTQITLRGWWWFVCTADFVFCRWQSSPSTWEYRYVILQRPFLLFLIDPLPFTSCSLSSRNHGFTSLHMRDNFRNHRLIETSTSYGRSLCTYFPIDGRGRQYSGSKRWSWFRTAFEATETSSMSCAGSLIWFVPVAIIWLRITGTRVACEWSVTTTE